MRRVDTAHQLQKLEPSLLSHLVLHRGYHDQRDVVTKRPLENTFEGIYVGVENGRETYRMRYSTSSFHTKEQLEAFFKKSIASMHKEEVV